MRQTPLILAAAAILLIVFAARSTLHVPAGGCGQQEQRQVRGTSLEPLLHDGDRVTLLRGYYSCHAVARGDIVAYAYAGDPVPIIKSVVAVPGDHFSLAEETTGVRIRVNDAPVRNHERVEYVLPSGRAGVLRLYAHDYPVLPAGTYLILGEDPAGTTDSTHFGLVDQTDIIGKVIIG